MPIYEFSCNKCRKQFELLLFSGDEPLCPECGNKELTKFMSRFSAQGVGSGPACSSGGSCGNCPPGHSCSSCSCH
ncbi:MAG: hypothetical protein A3J83_00655 [Elusimicrobia bacterium RIFOXYA2_FULL_40_6]|nr:MAG: hypothetical protein A3J83_00655 [Elusimicrobia bacterium RIFOXYA2_FULL_40_6]